MMLGIVKEQMQLEEEAAKNQADKVDPTLTPPESRCRKEEIDFPSVALR
jgi:hypothetical protein